MKKILFTAGLMIIFALAASAQNPHHRNHHQDSDDYSCQNDYSYNSHQYYRHRDPHSEARYHESKEIRYLQRELYRMKKHALKDGYISRREKRQIRELKYIINRKIEHLERHHYRRF